MLDEVIRLLKSCPLLSALSVTAELLREGTDAVSVQTVPEQPIMQRYADGSSLRQFVFVIALRKRPGEALCKAGESLLTDLGAWLEVCDTETLMLKESISAQRFEVLESSAVAGNTHGSFRYEMKCRLIYYQEGA
ncbi:MAG: hypothetical protein E7414_05860 [Ruminococcaceae bacterium]|nr:hypothetical protein [Oscillospiraceae bacterium]